MNNQTFLILFLIIQTIFLTVFSQKTIKDTLKPLNEILIEGNQKDLERLPILEGTRINAGKKNEIIHMNYINADLSTNNTRQIFAKVPGVSIWENDGSGIQVGVATRGLSPNRSWEFNVRQNGYDITSEAYGYPEAYYNPPMEALEKIEVIRGAASLQYGTQFGGLLNYVTKSKIGEKPFSFETQQTVGSYGLFNAYNAIGGKIKKFSYYGYFHHRTADGWRENSQYKTNTGFLKLSYEFNPKLKASIEYTHMNYLSQQAGGLTDTMFMENSRQSVRSRNWFSTPWNTASINVDYSISKNSKLNVKLFHTFSQRNSIGFNKDITIADTFNTSIGSYNLRQIDRDWYNNTGIEARFLTEYKFLDLNSAFSAGIRAYKGHTIRKLVGVGSGNDDFDLTIVSQYTNSNGSFDYKKDLNLNTLNGAVFIENMFQVTNNLSITPGIRLEYINTSMKGHIDKPTIGDSINLPNKIRQIVLGGVGAEYSTSKTSNLYANFTQAFRPATYSELLPAATTDSIDFNLKDASGYNIDFGFRGTFHKYLTFDVGGFYLFYDNRIGSIAMNNGYFKTNIGASVSQGIESFVEIDLLGPFSLNSNYGKLKVFANLAFIDAKYTRCIDPDTTKNYNGNYVENAPREIYRFGLTYQFKRFSISYQYNYIGSVFTDAKNHEDYNAIGTVGKLSEYQVMDLSATYLINGKYNVKAGVNNLTNESYATRRSTGYPGPGILPGNGRTFYFSIGAKF
jgi:Fe(3+) dicitrate transport protein